MAVCALIGCPSTTTNKQKQSERAKRAAEAIQFTENSEIENIQKRLKLTSNPGAIGYITLLNEMGQPILYTTVKGKVTSSGKRLTGLEEWKFLDAPRAFGAYNLVTAPSDEGTYGSSDSYIYFWDTNGQYYQWSGQYLYSDQPYRLTQEPLIVSNSK